jgi:SAM-dependent methyltransferase
MTSQFYALRGSSFSSTRDHPWPGWSRCRAYVERLVDATTVRVLDLACGNLRFSDYLQTQFPSVTWDYRGFDNAAAMTPPDRQIQVLDIMDALFRDDLDDRLAHGLRTSSIHSTRWDGQRDQAGTADLSVCFGFLHHVPTPDLRTRLVDAVIRSTRPGGVAILTAWQFALDPLAKAKAEVATSWALSHRGLTGLDAGDYLLGWQGDLEALRYSHSFSDAEIDELIHSTTGHARLLSRFRADGKTNAMNTYLVFQVG